MNQINPMTPRTRTILLLQGEDQDRLDELEAEVEALAPKKGQESAPKTLDEGDPHSAAVAAAEEFAAEAEGRGVAVVVRAVGRKTWREFVAKNAPRPDHDGDKAVGVNEDTFPDVLVPASIASPKFNSDVERDAFLDSLSDAQFDRLYYTAFALNRTTGADPKARRR